VLWEKIPLAMIHKILILGYWSATPYNYDFTTSEISHLVIEALTHHFDNRFEGILKDSYLQELDFQIKR